MAATGAATSTSARDRWTGLSAFVAAKTPAVNSSESPGRKKPSNSPVSAKMISRMPSSPNVSTRDRASSQLTARTASARCTLPGYRAPLDGDLGASGEHAVTERLVVVGGDAAGMSAASQARRRRGPDDLEIVAFERGSTTSYSACGIPYWIGDVVSDRNRLISRHPSTFRDSFAFDVRIRTEVEEINLDLGTNADVDGEGVPERRRVPADQSVAVADDVADPVRDAAGGVRRGRSPLESDDLQVVRAAPAARRRGRAHAGRVPTDHDQSFGHSMLTRCSKVTVEGRSVA